MGEATVSHRVEFLEGDRVKERADERIAVGPEPLDEAGGGDVYRMVVARVHELLDETAHAGEEARVFAVATTWVVVLVQYETSLRRRRRDG